MTALSGITQTHEIRIPSRTWWEMRRLKYNILVGTVGLAIVVILNLYIKKGASFDPVFLFTSISVAFVYALMCNLTYSGIWLLDHLSFGNEMVNFHSPKRTLILYVFVFLSCLVPFGIMVLVKNLL